MALAFGVASGAGAAAGLYSAIAAGIVAAIFGGSKFQVSGPTGGMVAVLVLVVSRYGVKGALIAGLIAGLIQIALGLAKLGNLIKFIPFSVTTGFTAGIALVIVLSQQSSIINTPLWVLATVLLSFAVRRLFPKIPASLVTVVTITVVAEVLRVKMGVDIPRLGHIPASLPMPRLPIASVADIRELFKPALVLAALGSMESLLSAVVADGMTVDEHHDSNRELIGQGLGNVVAPLFGGIAATGAIARTAVNIGAGAKTRVAAVVHSLAILAMMLFLAPLAARIPLAVLAGVLVVAAIRMLEWENITLIFKSSKPAFAVMGLTLAVTLLVDLVTAVEVGLIAAGALFVYEMSDLGIYRDESLLSEADSCEITPVVDPRIVAYRMDGPLFFGAAESFARNATAHTDMRFLVLRMRRVPMIDATGVMALLSIHGKLKRQGCGLMLSGLQPSVAAKIAGAGVVKEIGEENIFTWTREALIEAESRLQERTLRQHLSSSWPRRVDDDVRMG